MTLTIEQWIFVVGLALFLMGSAKLTATRKKG